jgi:hypothetical protein
MEVSCVTISGNNTNPAIAANITKWWNNGYHPIGTVEYEQITTDDGWELHFGNLAFDPECHSVLDQMATQIQTDALIDTLNQ